jgi:hypothetical protein
MSVHKNTKYNKEKFINFANEIHNNKFNYDNIEYKSYLKDKIIIKCIEHDKNIEILPTNHIKRKNGGCSECLKVQVKKIIKKPTIAKKIILLDGEIIKNINLDKYNENYCVSNFGKCFSKKTGKELSTQCISGYKKVKLRDNDKSESYNLHYLVYISFNTDYANNKVIDHKDGNKLNNNLVNLRCVTQSENVKNAYKNNLKMHQQNIIQAFDKNNVLIKEFDNIKDAYIFINHKNGASIQNCLRGINKTSGKYIWKFKDNKITEYNKNKYIDDIKDYISIGKISDYNFANYYINKEGIVVNTQYKNRKIKNFVNANGYKCVFLYYENNKKIQYLLHRLVAKYYFNNGNKKFNDNKYIVNHKDKDRLNNDISNLEWITQKENTIHGCGKKIAQIDLKTNNTIKFFNTIADAYRELNKPRNSLISKVCLNQKGRKSIYGYKWKYVEN